MISQHAWTEIQVFHLQVQLHDYSFLFGFSYTGPMNSMSFTLEMHISQDPGDWVCQVSHHFRSI